MRITEIECHVLVQPAYDASAASSSQDDIVVEIQTDELSESPLRKRLTNQQLEMIDGKIPVPSAPGLGVEINLEALEEFKAEGERVFATARRSSLTT